MDTVGEILALFDLPSARKQLDDVHVLPTPKNKPFVHAMEEEEEKSSSCPACGDPKK
jgi:hypothetical protein